MGVLYQYNNIATNLKIIMNCEKMEIEKCSGKNISLSTRRKSDKESIIRNFIKKDIKSGDEFCSYQLATNLSMKFFNKRDPKFEALMRQFMSSFLPVLVSENIISFVGNIDSKGTISAKTYKKN